MTIIERPLFGSVEIRRTRRNLIDTPRGTTAVGWQGSVGGGPAPALTNTSTAGMNVGGLGIDTFIRAQASTAGDYIDVRNAATQGLLRQRVGSVTASAWIRPSTIAGVSGVVYLQCYDAGGQLLATFTSSTFPLVSGGWTRVHVSGAIPAGTVRVVAIFRARGTVVNGSRLDATAFLVEHAATLGEWFETTAPAPGEIAAARVVTIRRGGARTGLGVKTDVGLLTFELLDSEDPMRGGTFQPGQEVRAVSLNAAGDMAELFTGRVVDVGSTYPLNKSTGRQRSVTTVTVADSVKTHGETPRYGVTIAERFETFESRIKRLAGSALAPIDPPVEGAPREVYAL